jgi:hypothetical protein
MKKLSILSVLFLFFINFSEANTNSIYVASSIPDELKENAHTVVRYEKQHL